MARLIDVEAAIERERKSDDIVGSSIWETSEVVMFLEDAPTVDAVEVVYGEWRLGEFNWGRQTVFAECSVCNAVFEVSSFILNLNYNYCPNCGAKMDGDGNG